MDFKIVLDDVDTGVTQYTKVLDDINTEIDNAVSAMEQLTEEAWHGMSSDGCMIQFHMWLATANELIEDIEKLRDDLKTNSPKMSELINKAKALSI